MRVYTYNNDPEAQKVKHLLETEGISCEIHSFENWGYDGIFRGQMGMGEILVPDHLASKAKEVIDKFIAGERDQAFEGDIELRRIRLERHVEQLNTLIYVIYAVFIIVSFFLISSMGLFGIAAMGLLTIGAFYAITHVKKELEKARQELEKIHT